LQGNRDQIHPIKQKFPTRSSGLCSQYKINWAMFLKVTRITFGHFQKISGHLVHWQKTKLLVGRVND